MKKYFAILLTILCLCTCLVPGNPVFADEPSVSIIFSSPTVEIGNAFTVTLRFKNDSATICKIDGTLTYDDSILEYKPNSESSIQGGDGEIHILETPTPGVDSLDIKLTFQTLKTGSSHIEINCDLYEDENSNSTPVSAGANLNVTNPTVALSSNANLASLSISYGTLEPAFSPDITDYKVAVENSVTKFPITAKAEDYDPANPDGSARVAITGSQNLSVGENKRIVTVTAVNGTQKAYTITIVRAAPAKTEPPEPSSTPDASSTPSTPAAVTTDPSSTVTETPSQTQRPWETDTLTQGTTPDGSSNLTSAGSTTPANVATATPSGKVKAGITATELKNTVLLVVVILAIIIIVILFTIVYCMQQKDKRKRSGNTKRKSGSRNRR